MDMITILTEVTFAAINYIVVSSIANSGQAKVVADLKLDLRTTKEDIMAEIKDSKSSVIEQVKDNRYEIENVAIRQSKNNGG